jgi:hypothetical protein
MFSAMPQFIAMILAAEYSWSGRKDPVDKLGYDPARVFRKMYFARPSPLSPRPGTDLGPSPLAPFTVGPIQFGCRLDDGLATVLQPAAANRGGLLSFHLNTPGKELAVALRCSVAANDGDPVADLKVVLANGETVEKTLVYGWHVRSADDHGGLAIADRNSAGECAFRIDLGPVAVPVKSIAVAPLNSYSGLTVVGLELL